MRPVIMLDSGAFSAWNRGVEIDLSAYIAFCLENLSHLDYIVNLDVIPASPGIKRISQAEIEESASKGWQNYKTLLRAGIPREKVIHVFHQNENFKWLEKMVAEVPYIGLSPANDRTTAEKQSWLDECMKYAIDKDGMPKSKWHGFAVTSTQLMARYPWYSVDSATWLRHAAYGFVLVPKHTSNGWDFSQLSTMFVSNQTPKLKEKGDHIETVNPKEREILRQFFEEHGFPVGKSVFTKRDKDYQLQKNEIRCSDAYRGKEMVETRIEDGYTNSIWVRREINLLSFNGFSATLPKWPWPYVIKKRGLGL